MKTLFGVLLAIALSATSCEKDNAGDRNCRSGELMTAVDYTGLDGCGILLKTNDEVYEAVNLGSFDLSIEVGKQYCVRFEEANDLASICMAGRLIRLTEIQAIAE